LNNYSLMNTLEGMVSPTMQHTMTPIISMSVVCLFFL